MNILITGICGYVGSRMAHHLIQSIPGSSIAGIDNLSRRGSEINVPLLTKLGVKVIHGDVRSKADWVIDCAANPSVLAGLSDGYTSEQLIGHNLIGTLNILEYCKRHSAGLVLLSSSRVYSIDKLTTLPLEEKATRLELKASAAGTMKGLTQRGIAEDFSTAAPISLYGATKLSSEVMALEYGSAYGFPVWINRCGVIAGPGQFGKIDQGIFSFWVYSCLLGRKLKYYSYGGKQVRDCVSAEDVARLVAMQMAQPSKKVAPIVNVGGGMKNALSLIELTKLCEKYSSTRVEVETMQEARKYDIPFYVTDCSLAGEIWNWKPAAPVEEIIEAIAAWGKKNIGFIERLL